MNLMGALAGFMQGRGDKAKFEREQALNEPRMKLQDSLLKLQLQKEKTALKETEMKQQLMSVFLQNYQQGAQGQTTPSGPEGNDFNQAVQESSGEKQGVVDQMAGMDPMMMAVMKMVTGLDTLGAERLSEQQLNNQRLARQGD